MGRLSKMDHAAYLLGFRDNLRSWFLQYWIPQQEDINTVSESAYSLPQILVVPLEEVVPDTLIG